MPLQRFRAYLRNELEAPVETRYFGSGWISGVIALILSIAGLASMVCMTLPSLFTTPDLYMLYHQIPVRLVLHGGLVLAFLFALLSLILREAKILGFTAIACILGACILGTLSSTQSPAAENPVFFGLDWFVLNILLTGMIFIPLERFFPKWKEQHLFREEWKEDLFYYFISSMLVQILTYLSLFPSNQILAHTDWSSFRNAVASQPFILQFVEIMLLTDLVQYWEHRLFHKIPALWKFHSVHHSAQKLDWMAGARMHFIEILCLRGSTVIPMMILGFTQTAVQSYIFMVYLYATLVHANIRWSPLWLSSVLVTPRFHHWHHGIEREAIDVNFSIHFPLLDKLFGTYYMPEDKWPSGYGIKRNPVPNGYMAQFLYPFRRKSKS